MDKKKKVQRIKPDCNTPKIVNEYRILVNHYRNHDLDIDSLLLAQDDYKT
jgi:hypothetical protein